MLLSELLKLDPAPYRVMGVVIDVDDISIPKGLKEVSFIAPPSPSGIDDLLLDIAISYLVASPSDRVDVIIEIPAENEITHPQNIWSTANQSELAIALLPPVTDDDDAFEAYVRRLETFVPLYCGQQRYSRSIMPITNYLQYLMIELMDPGAAVTFAPTDDYVIDRFASVMSSDRADAMKARVRQAFYDFYGGHEAFSAHYLDIIRGIYEASEQFAIDRKAELSAIRESKAEAIVESVAQDAFREYMGWLPDAPVEGHPQLQRFRSSLKLGLARHFAHAESDTVPALVNELRDEFYAQISTDIETALRGVKRDVPTDGSPALNQYVSLLDNVSQSAAGYPLDQSDGVVGD